MLDRLHRSDAISFRLPTMWVNRNRLFTVIVMNLRIFCLFFHQHTFFQFSSKLSDRQTCILQQFFLCFFFVFVCKISFNSCLRIFTSSQPLLFGYQQRWKPPESHAQNGICTTGTVIRYQTEPTDTVASVYNTILMKCMSWCCGMNHAWHTW